MRWIALLSLWMISLTVVQAQDIKYRRSSMYSVLIRHPEKEFGKDIDTVFRLMPLPEKYDEHNLKVRAINAGVFEKNNKTEEENTVEFLDAFIRKNQIAKRLVFKWFNRKEGRSGDGTFDMNLVIERGLYDASYFDAKAAEQAIRGQSILADAGEELIGNTYVLFNDIKYVDKEEASALASVGLTLLGAFIPAGGVASSAASLAATVSSDIVSNISGFRVSVASYLYRLDWNEDIANEFYSNYYITAPDPDKKSAIEIRSDLFSLSYVGCQKVVTGKTSMGGVADKNDMIRKVCTRAIDKNVAMLQKTYEEFRVKTPLFSVEPLSAKIGLKEDIDENSRFEVLEMVEDEAGRVEYKKVGEIRPIKNRIWDNRFMAEFEEENKDNDLTATEFEVVSGSGFYPGMLVREI